MEFAAGCRDGGRGEVASLRDAFHNPLDLLADTAEGRLARFLADFNFAEADGFAAAKARYDAGFRVSSAWHFIATMFLDEL